MHPIRVRRSPLICFAIGLLALSLQPRALASRSQPVGHTRALAKRAPIGPHIPGEELWSMRYDVGRSTHDLAYALGVSPDGTKVFVTGQSGGLEWRAYATIAYEASTGTPLWTQRYGGLEDRNVASSLAVSPDGTKIFVTGSAGNGQFGTIAYDASSGAQLWVELYGVGAGASALEVSPDGKKLFVTGVSEGDYATVAYDTSSGATLWVSMHDDGRARAVAVSPDGTRVFVTGTSSGGYATIAYHASSGALLWVRRYDGWPGRETQATSIGVSPDGSRLFVTGGIGRPSGTAYGTIAYAASTGTTLWTTLYGDTLQCCRRHVARSLEVSSDGSTVFVTGESERDPADVDYATVAYDASTGATLWAKRFTRGVKGRDRATSVVVSPDDASVFVTGGSEDDFATIGYEATTGATSWVSLFEGYSGEATSIAVSPDGTKVFVTGWLVINGFDEDYVTIAYSTR